MRGLLLNAEGTIVGDSNVGAVIAGLDTELTYERLGLARDAADRQPSLDRTP